MEEKNNNAEKITIKDLYNKQLIKKYREPLRQVKKELDGGKTIDMLIREINRKESKLSRSTRDFLEGFENEKIEELLKEYYG